MTAPVSRTTTRRRAAWRKASLGDRLRETRVYVDEDAYERVVVLAEGQGERLPITMGHLVEFALSVIDGKPGKRPAMPVAAAAPALPSIAALSQAILASRFPDDTGAARFRQLAFVHLIHAETLRDSKPTPALLAKLSGSHQSQMQELARVLGDRGVVVRSHQPNVHGAAYGKVLAIDSNAIENLKAAHLAATGAPLDLSQIA